MTLSLEPANKQAASVARPPDSAFTPFFFGANRAAIGTFAVFVVMIAPFIVASPTVFMHWQIYSSVLVTLPSRCVRARWSSSSRSEKSICRCPRRWDFDVDFRARRSGRPQSPSSRFSTALATCMALGCLRRRSRGVRQSSSLIATLGMNYMLHGIHYDRHAGQIDRFPRSPGHRRRPACFPASFSAFPCKSLGARLRRLRRVAVQSLSVGAVRAVGNIPTAPPRWAWTPTAFASRPSCSSALALRWRACSRRSSISLGGRPAATAICYRPSPPFSSAAHRPGAASKRLPAGRSAR